MSSENIEPYDFSTLDAAVYDPDNPAAYIKTANAACNDVMGLEESAWADAEAQAINDVEAYLRTYVIAAWRSLEMEHAEGAAKRKGRILPFRQAIILEFLLRSEEVEKDFLIHASQYTRTELLQRISEASAPWLTKYALRLDYDTEVENAFGGWEIFIDAQTN